MKILHIIDSGGLYGAEVMLLHLVAEQVKLGLEPTIVSIGEKHIAEKGLETEATKRGFRVKKFRMIPGPNIAGALDVFRFARGENFDLLHSHGYKGNVLFGFIPKKIRKLPLVATLHGWTSTKGFSKNRVYEAFDALSLRFIDAVVLVHKAMLNQPRLQNYRGINFHIVSNGIPLPNGDTPPHVLDQAILSFCQRGYTIGSIGRLSTEKGYKYLIEALVLLIKENIDARLVIIGEGYERKRLEQLVAEFDLTGRVLMPGYIKDAKYYLPHFDVFVMPSLTEGLPITLLEAMQGKVPIVASKVGGIPEVLQDGLAGLLIKPFDLVGLAEAVSAIYHNTEEAKQLTTAAYERAINDYSSEKMAEQYFDIYQKVLKHTRLN